MNRAVAGGRNLAGALGGLAAVRGETMPQVNIVAHSYGMTTAAVTLTQPGIHVDSFITLGSAGLPDSVDTAADLNAGQYSGHARDKIPFILLNPKAGTNGRGPDGISAVTTR